MVSEGNNVNSVRVPRFGVPKCCLGTRFVLLAIVLSELLNLPATAIPLDVYPMHRMLGLTVGQLTAELRKLPGEVSIYDGYAFRSNAVGGTMSFYDAFLISNGKVTAIKEVLRGNDRDTLGWIDRNGVEHPEIREPDLSRLKPVESYLDGINQKDLAHLRQRWHEAHPGVHITIEYSSVGNKPGMFSVKKTSTNSAYAQEALNMTKSIPLPNDRPIVTMPFLIEL